MVTSVLSEFVATAVGVGLGKIIATVVCASRVAMLGPSLLE